MNGERTYLDHNATAPLRAEARAAMLVAFDLTGNASSVHAEGRRARQVVEEARAEVAALIDASPDEVFFTGSATEANNWAIRGGWDALAVGAIEHDSVLAPARASGLPLFEIPAGSAGTIYLDALEAQLRSSQAKAFKRLISVQLANAETGIIQPVAEAVVLAREHGANFHTDAVQAMGRVRVSFRKLSLDLASISAHKLGGPKGVGALVIRNGVELSPLLLGGGQEGRRRAGTENVAAIAGFGAAAKAARQDLAGMDRIAALRDRLEAGVREMTPGVNIIGKYEQRLPNTSCIAYPHAQAATMLIKLDLAGVAVSAGSACSSGKIGGSHVLAAMYVDPRFADAAIRISLGPNSTDDDIEHFLDAWADIHRVEIARRGIYIKANSATTRAPNSIPAGE